MYFTYVCVWYTHNTHTYAPAPSLTRTLCSSAASPPSRVRAVLSKLRPLAAPRPAYTYIHIYRNIFLCVCVCVCVFVFIQYTIHIVNISIRLHFYAGLQIYTKCVCTHMHTSTHLRGVGQPCPLYVRAIVHGQFPVTIEAPVPETAVLGLGEPVIIQAFVVASIPYKVFFKKNQKILKSQCPFAICSVKSLYIYFWLFRNFAERDVHRPRVRVSAVLHTLSEFLQESDPFEGQRHTL